MSSAEEIKQREAQSENETPNIASDGSDGDDGNSQSLPLPSFSQKHAVLLGVIVAAIIAWKLYQRRQAESGGQSSTETTTGDGDDGSQSTPSRSDEEFDIPENNSDPLAGDEAIVQEFRDRGRLSESAEA